MKRIVVVGAGGFAREVAWLIDEINRACPTFQFLGFAVSDCSRLSTRDSSDRVVGDFDWLQSNRGSIDCLAVGVGTPAVRRRLVTDLERRLPDIEWPPLLHPSVSIDHASAAISPGVLVCAGVLATVNVVLGPFCLVNLGCTLGHEARVGSYCVLNPLVIVSGGVELEPDVLVGTGAKILQYLRVGEGATVGAGAVVTRNVVGGSTVVGVPAKPVSQTRE